MSVNETKEFISETEKKKILGDNYERDKDVIDWNYLAFKKKLKGLNEDDI